MLLCDVTMTLIRQEKKETSFSSKAYMFPLENEYKSLLPRNAHGTYNTAYTNYVIIICHILQISACTMS